MNTQLPNSPRLDLPTPRKPTPRRPLFSLLTSLCLLVACLPATPTTPPTSTYTPTLTPSATMPPATATFTPVPELPTETPVEPAATLPPPSVWKIFFFGEPCIGENVCDFSLPDNVVPLVYSINSDGTGLTTVGKNLAEAPDLPPQLVPFLQGPGLFYDRLKNDCFGFYDYAEFSPINQVVVKQLCLGETTPQVIDTVEFPSHADGQGDFFRFYRISPQGDKLLAYVQHQREGDVDVYVKKLKSNEAPLLVFHSSRRTCQHYWFQNAVHDLYWGHKPQWHPDGTTIDLLWTSICDEQVENIFYEVDWQGQELKTRLSVSGFIIDSGDWSPDHRQFAFWYHPIKGDVFGELQGTMSGVHLLDLETGNQHPVITEFLIAKIWAENK